ATAGPLAFGTNITNNGKVITIAGPTNTAISGVISGGGGVTKVETGTLTLTGSNTFTGNLFGKSGTVVVDANGVVNTAGSYISIGLNGSDGATLTLKGNGALTTTSDFNAG